ncbi:MAG: hypothetical protein ACODAQ_06835 [Phycisphaeraceae bacterium]
MTHAPVHVFRLGRSLLAALITAHLVAPVAWAQSDFEHAYDADAAPTDAEPAWQATIDHDRSMQRLVAADQGVLTVATAQTADNIAWSVGTWSSAEGDEAWQLTADGQATIDFRVRVTESTPAGAFQLQVANGENYWTFFFSEGSVTLHRSDGDQPRVSIDNSRFQTCRLVMQADRATLYAAERDEPLIDAAAASGTFGASRRRNALTFGEFSGGAKGRFDLDFVRWSDEAAEMRAPQAVEDDDPAVAETDELRRAQGRNDGRPSVLFIGRDPAAQNGGATRKMFLRDLFEKHGFHVATRRQEFAYRDDPGEVDPDEFSSYDVIVYLHPVWPHPDGTLTDSFQRQWDAVLEFVEQGGGLLLMPSPEEPYRYASDKVLRPLGVRMLQGKPVDAAATQATVMRIYFSRTERFAQDHPITQDLERLWLPVYGHERQPSAHNANTISFRADDQWDVIARHAPSVRTVAESYDGLSASLPTPTEADHAQAALLATRALGEGRVAVFGVDAAYHIIGGHAPGYEGIVLREGLKGQPSDGEKLIVNTLGWLSENAVENPQLGGAPTEPEAIEPPTFKPQPSLDAPDSFNAQRPGYKGMIGAISPRSGGQHTVAEYADKAESLGFDFLVVLDDLGEVTEAEFEQTNRACADATTEDFKCIPGLRARDEVGNHYVMFRQGLVLPEPNMITDDDRFETVYDHNTSLGIAKWVQANGHNIAVVFYRTGPQDSDDPFERGTPAWNIRPYRTFHSVFTYDADGEKLDEMIEPHKTTVNDGQHPHPVAITFMDELSDMDRVASGELPHTVRWTGDFDRFPEDTDEASGYRPTTYATEGPRITRWQWDSRDLVSNGKYWDWTYYYQRWAIGVESEVGLETVEIWDGDELVRRWRPEGRKTFETVCTVNKHQLTMPLIIATDVNGKRAVTDGFQWRSHNFFVSWCTDRVNTLSYSALPAPDSPWASTAGTWPLTTQPKGPYWDDLRVDLNLTSLRLPGFDGQAHGNVRINPKPHFYPADGEPRDGRHYRHITWPMGSHEAVVQESRVKWQLLPEQQGPHAWSTLGPIRETDVFEGRLRYTTFVHWGHEPAPILVEGEYTFKQDVKASPDRRPFQIAHISAGQEEADYRGAAIQRTSERDHVFALLHNQHDNHRADGRLPHGAYVWYWPSMFGPVGIISLDDKLRYRLRHAPNRYHTRLYFGEPGRTYEKGETVRWRYLAVTSGFNDHAGTQTPERIVDLMGIDGSPGYTIDAQAGTVADTQYMLTLNPADDGGGFRGTITPDDEIARGGLPAALPIIVDGLNDDWTAMLWDEARGELRPLARCRGPVVCALPRAERAALDLHGPSVRRRRPGGDPSSRADRRAEPVSLRAQSDRAHQGRDRAARRALRRHARLRAKRVAMDPAGRRRATRPPRSRHAVHARHRGRSRLTAQLELAGSCLSAHIHAILCQAAPPRAPKGANSTCGRATTQTTFDIAASPSSSCWW